MIPPKKAYVRDRHGGIAVLLFNGSTLHWPADKATKYDQVGDLISYREGSFYQQNDNVTQALYRVDGIRYPVIVWWNNVTGQDVCGGRGAYMTSDVMHLLAPGGDRRAACGAPAPAPADATADINYVTCPACEAAHAQWVRDHEED